MKQTSSALTFLLAQYRAIFKRAYIKGIASAVLLTAGLAAGAASGPAMAAVNNNILDVADFTATQDDASGASITQSSSINIGSFDATKFNKGWTYIGDTDISGKDVKVNVIGGVTTQTSHRHIAFVGSNGLTIKDGASFDLTNSASTNTQIYGGTNGNSGTITVSGEGSALSVTKGSITFNKAVISDGATVTVGGLVDLNKTVESKAQNADWRYYSNIFAKNNSSANSSGTFTIDSATVNLNDQSQILAGHSMEITGNSIINFKGEWHDAETGTGYASAFMRGVSDTSTVNITGDNSKTPLLHVESEKHGAIYSDNISLTASRVQIDSGSSFTLDGDFNANTVADEGRHHALTKLTLDDVFFDNQGTAIIGNATSGGTAEVVSGTTTLTGNVKNYAKVTVKGESDDGKDATLVVSANQLTDEAKKAKTGWFAGASGAIVLSGGAVDTATLEIQDIDADGFEVSDLTFTSGNAAANDLVGKIGVSGDGTIAGSHLTLSKALTGDMGTNKLRLAADTLEISSDSITTLSDFKATGGFKVQDNIDIDVSGGEATVDTAIDLSRDYYVQVANGSTTINSTTLNTVGKITGDDLKINGADGDINITGGAFENERQSLTITSGGLTVQAEAGTTQSDGKDSVSSWKYYNNSNPASLKWNGDFTIAGADHDDATITVSGATGANATLDLTDANVTWNSGTVTVQGTANAEDVFTSATDYFAHGGNAILKIEGNDLTNFIAGKTKLNVKTGGLVLIDGSVPGNVDVGSFESEDSASAAGKVNLSGGFLFATGTLNLTADTAEEKLNAASALIGADNLTVNNTNSGTDTFTVSGANATLAAASSFTSDDTSVVFEAGSTLLLDTNGFLKDYTSSANDSTGTVNVDKLSFTGTTSNDANLDVQTGAWTVVAGTDADNNQLLGDIDMGADTKLNIGAGKDEVQRTGIGASLTADNLGITGSGSVDIGFSGAATFNTMQQTAGTVSVDAGTLTLTGNLTDTDLTATSVPATLKALGTTADDIKAVAGINLSGTDIAVKNGGKFVLEDAAAKALVKFNYTDSANTKHDVWVSENLGGADITLTNNSELKLNFAAGSGELTADQAGKLQGLLLTPESDGTSYISVGQMGFAIDYDEKNMITTWNDVKDFANYNVTNETMKQLLVTGVGAEDIAGHYGAVAATTGTNKIGVDGNLSLHSARGGYFTATTDAAGNLTGPAAVDLVSNNSTFTLEGQGTVGTITGTGTDANDGNTVIFGQGTYQAGTTKVEGDVLDVTKVQVQNDVVVTGDVEVGAVAVTQSMTAENVTLVGDPTSTDTDMTSTVFGTLQVNKELTVGAGNDLIVAGGSVNTETLSLDDDSSIVRVGWDAQDLDTIASDIDESKSYSGVLVAQTAALNGGTLVVDPDFTLPSAMVAIGKFADAPVSREVNYDLGTVDGNLLVAQNSVLGLGFATEQELRDFVANHQTNGILTEYGSIAAVKGKFNLTSTDGLSLTNLSVDEYVDHITKNSNRTFNADGLTMAGTIYFGTGTALKVDGEVLNNLNGDALITFQDKNGTLANGTLIADGGEILIAGDLRAASYQLFKDVDNKIAVENLDGTDSTSGIKVSTESGLLVGTVTNGSTGSVTMGVDKANARSILSGVSDPVYDTIMAYINGYNSSWTDDNGPHYDWIGTPTVDSDNDGVKDSVFKYSNTFISDSYTSADRGAAVETAARLGVYGGAPQAALSAGKSSTDAIASRFGIGSALSNLTMAGNSAGATLWLSPVYKTAESDSFAAQGVDYGVDVDLYGVALGGDYTMSNGVTIGAMFNVGSGEVDGSGAAASASNDFDYYGFGLYAGYTLGQFSVVGDVSYTVADNEVEASTAVDHIGAQMDSANLSVGVTGKYALEFNGVSVTPHVGLRFTNIDLDDYTIDGEDVIASADSDKLNIFSIPVGVTIAKEFKGESWTVAPSFDLTLTGQFGDDELDGSVNWAGVENLTTDTSTEVIDNFTYGATLGVEAQSVSGFALGVGVGYTGSSETDEFSAQAKVRYTF